jgi:penicillin-binding protein 2
VVIDSYLDPHPERDRRPLRFVAFGVAVVLVFSGLTARLAYLQITNGAAYVARAEANRTVQRPLPALRGLIYDREGRLLVANVATYSVKIMPSDLPFSRRADVAQRLGALLGMDPSDILATLDTAPGSRFDLVRIAQDVPEATARIISESGDQLPGVQVAIETRRDYLDGSLMSQILGYTGAIDAPTLARLGASGYLPDDLIGRTGVEATFESQLRGTYGQELVERDATGRDIQVLQTLKAPVAGDSLTLTIDATIQQEAQDALSSVMKEVGIKRGVFIVENPQTGEILAMVSLPSYDDNLFAKGISTADFKQLVADPAKPLTNHALQDNYPPGSTFKLVTGSGGLQDGKITPQTPIETKPFLQVGETKYWDWNHTGFGLCNLNCGFGHSSDTYFFTVAGMLGADRLAYWANQFGFGQPTGIDLPGEAAGTIPSNQWKIDALGQPMYTGEVYQAGIGQGYDVVTPLQLVNAYAALANGGKLYRPQIVSQVTAPDGTVVQSLKPDLIRTLPISPKNLLAMRLAARNVLVVRHTYNFVDMPIKVAGKSGTAEFGLRDAQGRLPYHSWFVGFVPKDPYQADFTATDSPMAFLAFAYDSRTVGNAATEIVKTFVQLHWHIAKDYVIHDLLVRGNFYASN